MKCTNSPLGFCHRNGGRIGNFQTRFETACKGAKLKILEFTIYDTLLRHGLSCEEFLYMLLKTCWAIVVLLIWHQNKKKRHFSCFYHFNPYTKYKKY